MLVVCLNLTLKMYTDMTFLPQKPPGLLWRFRALSFDGRNELRIQKPNGWGSKHYLEYMLM